jgi:hypothetical protein
MCSQLGERRPWAARGAIPGAGLGRRENSLQNFAVSNFEQTDLTTENIILQWKRRKRYGEKQNVLCDWLRDSLTNIRLRR